ncbi:MAG: flagellin N-terminal helical domain-containing protein [Christensenellales bacterium]
MRITNNIMALNTHRQYTINNDAVAKSTAKLSSGYRINSAADDAAGLAISEKMRAQIRGLDMASKNSQDAISLVQTAEGALTETHAILQRMRELAVQSSTDTNEDGVDGVDRTALDSEFQALKAEIDDIASKTAFNNKKLLNGTFGTLTSINTTSDLQIAQDGIVSMKFEGFAGSDLGTAYTISFTQVAPGDPYTATLAGADPVTVANVADADGQTLNLSFSTGQSVSIKLAGSYAVDGLIGDLEFTVTNDEAVIQTGANEGDTLEFSIGNMTATGLSINATEIGTRATASTAITTINSAINDVSSLRANLGALQNRLQHKINNLDTSSENLQAAESRIRDLDMAKEMTTFTKNNILGQAATAMLAQANAVPQGVLKLFQ